MKRTVQFLAALAVSLVVAQGTALACFCGMCTKTASPAVIGPDYPAGGVPVTYTVTLACQPNFTGAMCQTVDSVIDTPFGGTLVGEWTGFGAASGGNEAITKTYTVNFTWDMCRQYGGDPLADGSVKVLNFVSAKDSHISPDVLFSCQREIICKPPNPPGGGCSLTPGYWKTHTVHGPAAADATWAKITPAGADSPFFNPPGTQTWFEVLWTDAEAGNAYYILARAYIAAKLNLLAGASAPDEVSAAIAWAEGSFFNAYGPSAMLTKQLRAQALGFAGILDNYNNGYIGPGHCP